MYQINIFKNSRFGDLVYIIKENAPWFLVKNITEVLNYNQPSDIIKRLDERDIDKIDLSSITNIAHCDSIIGGHFHRKTSEPLMIINELGLYDAILYSGKPNAKEFRRWVVNEVLPQIRKKGQDW